MKGRRKISNGLMKAESSKITHQHPDNPDKESDETLRNKRDDCNESDDQSSPRGVLEVSGSCSDSDNSSMLFGEKSQATGDGDGAETAPWRNLIGNLKRKSLRRFSMGPLVAGYELSKKGFMNKLGRNNSSDASINDCYMPKPSWRNFTFQELAVATNGFCPDNLVGKGGHAEVYKGCLPDGQIVAVKKITKKEKKDEDRVGDFLTELGIIAHINHPNAARLIGFSSDNGLYLVLQFAPYGSLATVLQTSEENLDWDIRFKIVVGIAEGLRYLHYECNKRIIHRDITASNVLLAEDYEPQISDFGLAKWLPEKWAQQVVSPVEGTFGYMAPEYFMHGVIDEKTDVFAFGVLLLELITGRCAVDSRRQSLVIWAKPLLEKGKVKELVDPRFGKAYELNEVKRTVMVASSCIHHTPDMRPNMKRVVQILTGESATMELRQKTFDGRSIVLDACDLEGYTSTTYLNDLSRHRQLIMERQIEQDDGYLL